jgi:hypothetical protein
VSAILAPSASDVPTPESLLSFEGASFLEAGLVLIFLSSLAIAFPNADLSDRVDPSLSFIRRRLDPFGSIRLGALKRLLQCNIMTACGRKRNVFRSVVIEARIESRLAAILAADVAGRIVKTAVTVPWSDLRALSTPRAAPWKSSALWPIRNPDDRRIEFRIGINVGDIIVDACATVNAGKEHFRKSPDKLTFEHVRDTQRQFVYTHPWPSTTWSFGTIGARCTVEPSSTTCGRQTLVRK